MKNLTKNYREELIKSLKDPHEAISYLDAALMDDDPRVFLLALKDVADAMGGGMSEFSKKSKMNRESLYRTFSEKGNPKLNSLYSILSSFGFRFSVQKKENRKLLPVKKRRVTLRSSRTKGKIAKKK